MKTENENDFQTINMDAALENRIKNKKRSTGFKVCLVICIVLAVILAIAGCGLLALKVYMRDKLDLMNYTSDPDVSEIVSSIKEEYSDRLDEIVDLEIPPDAPDAPEPDSEQMPSFEIIEGKFDGETVSDDYEDEVLNILLVGADTLDGENARSDTMILMSVNMLKERIVLTSFMRDSYLELPGLGYQRLNAAHSLGGTAYLIETIEYNFGVDIDYYFKVDFTSFREAVDAIDGIDLVVNDDNYDYFEDWDGIRGLSRGEACDGNHVIHLNGEQALLYARDRKYKTDDGDFGRTRHQRDFLSQFINNCKDASLGELNDLLDTLLPYTVTNMPADVIEEHIWNILTYVSYDISDARVPVDGSWSNYRTPKGQAVININVPANRKYIKAVIYG